MRFEHDHLRRLKADIEMLRLEVIEDKNMTEERRKKINKEMSAARNAIEDYLEYVS